MTTKTKKSMTTKTPSKAKPKSKTQKTAARKAPLSQSTARKTNRNQPVKNRISEVVYESAKGLYNAGLINKTTMREFDELCLPKVPDYTPRQIKAIRDRFQKSQAVFAAYMNISASS